MPSLKSAHHIAMQPFFLTDKEIEEDWERVCRDLGILSEERAFELPDDKPLDMPF